MSAFDVEIAKDLCDSDLDRIVESSIEGHWRISHRAISKVELWSDVVNRRKCDVEDNALQAVIDRLKQAHRVDITVEGNLFPYGKDVKTGPLPSPDEIEPKPKDAVK